MITPECLNQWLTPQVQTYYVTRLMGRVGLTRRRAECFIRLWAYLWLKQRQLTQAALPAVIDQLEPPMGWVPCTCREAAELFYVDQERGSDRSAGMMLDKLVALGLLQKRFDGNTLNLAVSRLPDLAAEEKGTAAIAIKPDGFDPRCDAIPVANLLATNYNWMNHNADAVPYRIAGLLRQWADQYGVGMRVLRRLDNLNPVGFYLLYPTQHESEVNFFGPATKGLHLSGVTEQDPFLMAHPGDTGCRAVFIRSWMIAAEFQPVYQQGITLQSLFLRDAQTTLRQMQQDFPNLCDLHTLIIHPSYETLARSLGFQRLSQDTQASVYWMYLALDRFLALEIPPVL